MAKRATNPEEIQAIQQSLVAGVQNGSIQPYIGIPLIQDLTKKLTEAKASMAQNVAGAGMPQPPAGGPPIAQQVMQQAAQADQSQGVEALPSNLPQSYAGGGIIAFEEGGQVERYQSGGTPAGRFFSGIGQSFSEADEAAKLRNQLQMKYGPASALPGLFMTQTDEQRQTAKDVAAALPNLTLEQLKQLNEQGPSGLPFVNPALAASQGIPTPAQQGAYPGGSAPPSIKNVSRAAPAASGAGGDGGGGSKMPVLAGMKETAFPALKSLSDITEGTDTKTKAATEDAVKASQTELEGFDKPGFEAREGRLSQREAAQDKDSAIGRALNLMSLGFGIAGSKERSLAGALGKEGREGIVDLIKGEAANRAAKDRLEDARDNLKQQEIAAKKGNYQAAQAAGERAADNVYKYQTFSLAAAQAGNTQAIQRYEAEGNQAFRKASLDQSGKLGIAELDLKQQQLRQSAASASAQLQLGREKLDILKGQIAAGNERARATLLQAENKAASTWQSSPDYREAQAQASKMAPTEAQRFMQNSWLQYKENMLPSLMGGQGGSANVPSFSDLYKATE
jgi:type II secretory pathway pseudopilin PulG